jgi:hypothetical protein
MVRSRPSVPASWVNPKAIYSVLARAQQKEQRMVPKMAIATAKHLGENWASPMQ